MSFEELGFLLPTIVAMSSCNGINILPWLNPTGKRLCERLRHELNVLNSEFGRFIMSTPKEAQTEFYSK